MGLKKLTEEKGGKIQDEIGQCDTKLTHFKVKPNSQRRF